jgi:PAS domain S-box-containing protein
MDHNNFEGQAMTEFRVLFVDHHHFSSRIAAAYFDRYAPRGISAVSAGVSPQPLDQDGISLFTEQGLPRPDERCVSIEECPDHFDLAIALGLKGRDAMPRLPSRLFPLHWDIEVPEEKGDPESRRRHAGLIESAVKHFFHYGYHDAFFNRTAFFENVFESLNEGVLVHDLSRRIFFFSRGAEKITGVKKEAVLGQDCHDLFSPRLCGNDCVFCKDGDCGNGEAASYRSAFIAPGDVRKELSINRVPLKNETGAVIGAILAISDATRLVRLEEKSGITRSFSGIIGRDHTMLAVFELIRDIGGSDYPVIITGESGTGKELVAAAIHNESTRRDRTFLAVNCGALPEGILESELFGHVKGSFTGAIRDKKGRFELADKGTLFLDEIAELTPRMQVKLLRVLQEGIVEPVGGEIQKKVDVRVICATNRDLKALIAEGLFRNDLYYRLAVMPIELPPLRNRRGDIELLAGHFLDEYSKKLGKEVLSFSEEAMGLFMRYDWPGNVRQLQNAIQFALIKCRDRQIRPLHLPSEITDTVIVSTGMPKIKGKAGRHPKLSADAVDQALARAGGNKAKAARILGVGRATLYNFLNEHPEGRDHRA